MAWNEKINEKDFESRLVKNLADRPNATSTYGVGGMSAKQLKEWFDNSAHFLKDKINAIIEALGGVEALTNIRITDESGKEVSAKEWIESKVEVNLNGKVIPIVNWVEIANKAISDRLLSSEVSVDAEPDKVVRRDAGGNILVGEGDTAIGRSEVAFVLANLVAQTLDGFTEEEAKSKAPSVQAVNEGLAEKAEVQKFTSGKNRMYCARPNNPNSYYELDNKPWMNCIPVYTNVESNITPNTSKYGQATIVVASPKHPYQSANMKYVDDTAAAIRAELGKHVFTVFQWSYDNQGWYVPHGALPIFYLETTLLEYSYVVDDVCAENFAKANFTKLTFLDENNNILDTKPATSQTFYEMPSGTAKIHHNGVYLDYNPPWDSCVMRLTDLKFQVKVGA